MRTGNTTRCSGSRVACRSQTFIKKIMWVTLYWSTSLFMVLPHRFSRSNIYQGKRPSISSATATSSSVSSSHNKFAHSLTHSASVEKDGDSIETSTVNETVIINLDQSWFIQLLQKCYKLTLADRVYIIWAGGECNIEITNSWNMQIGTCSFRNILDWHFPWTCVFCFLTDSKNAFVTFCKCTVYLYVIINVRCNFSIATSQIC